MHVSSQPQALNNGHSVVLFQSMTVEQRELRVRAGTAPRLGWVRHQVELAAPVMVAAPGRDSIAQLRRKWARQEGKQRLAYAVIPITPWVGWGGIRWAGADPSIGRTTARPSVSDARLMAATTSVDSVDFPPPGQPARPITQLRAGERS